MINRKAIKYLCEWKESNTRKPLILRGERHAGKSSLVDSFSSKYRVYLKLNLLKEKDFFLFEKYTDVTTFLMAVNSHHKTTVINEPTLLFIEEIQRSPEALEMITNFHDEAPHIHVIAAGSLLDSILNSNEIFFPDGSVEFYTVPRCSYLEFLDGFKSTFKTI